MNTLSSTAKQVLQFVNQTHQSIFLTGKAGTGKTTLLHQIIQNTHKNTVVVAPTGIAALNAGGVTIHSMFQLPFGGFIPSYDVAPQMSQFIKFETKDTLRKQFKMNNIKRSVVQNMDLLIIDEVSMLRADVLDAVDFMMRKVRRKERPFGGVQVLYIGDLLQLPPVVKNEEWHVLKKYYKGIFFFNAQVVQQNPPLYVELTHIYRQTDKSFVSLLNNLRNNKIASEDMLLLNQYVKPDFDLKANKGYITLTTHNAKAETINSQALIDLNGVVHTYTPEIVGDFPEKIFPVDEFLHVKVGAQIMFIKNDLSTEKNYFNGKMGFIHALSEHEILVRFPAENKIIEVEKYEWKNIRYKVNETTKVIAEEVLGTFVHYPIKLAWAITVHKSQGLTFDKAALDVSQVFLPGQAYVALSRLRSLEGLILLQPIRMNGISNDQEVMNYAENKADEQTIIQSLQKETHLFIHNYVKSSFDWSELAQEWRNHRFSYKTAVEKSEKSKHQKWAEVQEEKMTLLLDASQKFRQQLDRLFHAEEIDIPFISERIKAAYDYFFPKLDDVLFDLLLKMEEVVRRKGVKEFYAELFDLEEHLTKAILQLFKALKMMEILAEGREFNKENLSSDSIRNYRNKKIEAVQAHFKTLKTELIEADERNFDPYHFLPKSKKAKVKSEIPKKSTVQETYELWQQKNSVQEIAKIRVLTPQTIYGHLGKLIQAGTITLAEVLPENKISELAKAFEGYNEESLNALKEQVGNQFTWEELRLFKSSL